MNSRCCLLAPKGASKIQTGRFSYKSGFLWEKVCYKVSLCEKFQQECSKAFNTIYNKWLMDDGGHPLLLEMVGQRDLPVIKIATFCPHSFVAPQP